MMSGSGYWIGSWRLKSPALGTEEICGGACAASRATPAAPASAVVRNARRSVPRDFEITFCRPLRPRAGHESRVGADVFHFAVDHDAHRRAARVLAFAFEMH